MNWTEADVIAYMVRRGLPLDATLTVPTRPAPDAMPEDAFLAKVRRYALDRGWLFHHVRDSRGCDPGFPDCCLAKPGRLIFAELKTSKGKLTQEQAVWLDVLRHTIPHLEVYCWRPQDIHAIRQILAHKESPAC